MDTNISDSSPGAKPRAPRSLRHWVERHGPLSVGEAAEVALLVCVAIAEGHGRGLAYGRICPDDVLWALRPDGSLLVGLGIHGIPRGGAVPPPGDLRSLAYRAPEALRTPASFDERSDIWALGAVLFYLLTGHEPFAAENARSVLAKVLDEPAPDVRDVRRSVPAALECILRRCLEKSPQHRYADLTELARALTLFGPDQTRGCAAEVARHLENAVNEPIPLVSRTPTSSPPQLEWTGMGARGSSAPPDLQRGRRALGIALATLASAGLVSIIVLALGRVSRAPPAHAAHSIAPMLDRVSSPEPPDVPPVIPLPPAIEPAPKSTAESRPRVPVRQQRATPPKPRQPPVWKRNVREPARPFGQAAPVEDDPYG
jgi:serine/threonine protein kinase